MMPISKLVIQEELDFTQRVLSKWQESLKEGIPEAEIPAHEGSADLYFYEMCGELALLSEKLATIARIMSESRGV